MAATTFTIPGEEKFLKKELTVFLLLAVALSWPVVLLIISQLPPDFKTGDVAAFTNAVGSTVMLYGLGPIISATIVTLIYRGRSGLVELFRRVFRWKVSLKWYTCALFFPGIAQWIGVLIWGHLTGNDLNFPTFSQYVSSWLQITFVATAFYITEEVGWRGFMLPRVLSLHSWIKSSLLVGAIWSVWHYPMWITAWWSTTGSFADTSIMVIAYSAYSIGLSVIATLIFKNTNGSILLAMILHGSSNANLDKMKAVAGDLSLQGSSFAVVQACTFLVTVVLLLLVMRNYRD